MQIGAVIPETQSSFLGAHSLKLYLSFALNEVEIRVNPWHLGHSKKEKTDRNEQSMEITRMAFHTKFENLLID